MNFFYLPTRRLKAAQVFSSVVNTQAVLIGGAADMLHGHGRSIKVLLFDKLVISFVRCLYDLDVDLDKAPSSKLIKNLAALGIILRKHPEKKNRFTATAEKTAPGNRDGASIDIAIRPGIPRIVEAYGIDILCMMVPKPQYLLMMKIRAVCERPPGAHGRIKQDMDNIFFLCREVAIKS